MPSPTTAGQIIEDALGLTNAVGVDQTLTADEISDGLRAFNDLLEIFSTQNLAVYGQANQTFNTISSQAVYTIGTGGDWNTVRPERIEAPGYSVVNTVSYPVLPMSQDEYDGIPFKNQPQEFPNRYLYVNSFPLGIVTLWPIPNAITPVTFVLDRILTAISSAGAAVSWPPGYAMVFKYKLAILLAPLFGKKLADYPDVVAIANSSFADVCRANKKRRLLTYDPALMQRGRYGLQAFIGGY